MPAKPTKSILLSRCRDELMDPDGRWWEDSEINSYLVAWQNAVQEQTHLVWGTATQSVTGTSSTFPMPADMLQPGYVFWGTGTRSGVRKPYVSRHVMDANLPDWRVAGAAREPSVTYLEEWGTYGIWPPLYADASGTALMIYPKEISLTSGTSTSELPHWAIPSAVPYVAWRAYQRRGPNEDLRKAQQYKTLYQSDLVTIRARRANYFPAAAQLRLRPADPETLELISPTLRAAIELENNVVNLYNFVDEEPTGAVNGTNTTFTLSTAPDPASSLNLWYGGVLLGTGTGTNEYTLSSGTVTTNFAPQTGNSLWASYRVEIA